MHPEMYREKEIQPDVFMSPCSDSGRKEDIFSSPHGKVACGDVTLLFKGAKQSLDRNQEKLRSCSMPSPPLGHTEIGCDGLCLQ